MSPVISSRTTFCRVHGLLLRSEIPLPLTAVETRRPADVTVRVASTRHDPVPPNHSRQDDPDDPWAIESWLDGRLVVEFPESAAFDVATDAITLLTDDTADPDFLAHLILDHVLPRVVALRGDLMLHAAAAVGPSGRAHVFVGETGAGKSTLAAALASHGWPLLDDDGIRLTTTGQDLRAVPGAPSVRLLPDAATTILPDAGPGTPLAAGHPKRRFDLTASHPIADAPAPVGGVYLLEARTGSRASLERIGLAEIVRTVARHGFHIAAEPTDITRRTFEHATALAEAAPVWRLLRPDAIDDLPGTLHLLEEHDARLDPARHGRAPTRRSRLCPS